MVMKYCTVWNYTESQWLSLLDTWQITTWPYRNRNNTGEKSGDTYGSGPSLPTGCWLTNINFEHVDVVKSFTLMHTSYATRQHTIKDLMARSNAAIECETTGAKTRRVSKWCDTSAATWRNLGTKSSINQTRSKPFFWSSLNRPF